MARTGCGWGATANAASSSSVGPRPGRLRPFLLRFVHSSFSLPLSLRRFSSSTHFLPSPFASFRSVRSLSLSLCSFHASAFQFHILFLRNPFLRSAPFPRFSIPLSPFESTTSLLHPSLSCEQTSTARVSVSLLLRSHLHLHARRAATPPHAHERVCKACKRYLGMREAWPDRGTSGGTRKLRGREVTHGGGNPPPPFPMWLLPIDFVRVRGRSNTCYRVGWKRVEGTRRGQMEEEEEDRVGVGELMASG